MEKVQKRLASWKIDFFSKAGRLALVRSMLSGIPIYYFFLFRALREVCESIRKLMHNFLGGEGVDVGKGKELHLVGWEAIERLVSLGARNWRI